jgi:hypothetical protein
MSLLCSFPSQLYTGVPKPFERGRVGVNHFFFQTADQRRMNRRQPIQADRKG